VIRLAFPNIRRDTVRKRVARASQQGLGIITYAT
jgi:hypothetical protein